MSTRSKQWFGLKLLKKVTLPFRFAGQKVKAEMQRFVMKTIQKQGGFHPNAPQAEGGLSAELVLSMLRNRTGAESPVAMQAIPVGELLLTKHPSGAYFYHRPDHQELEKTPAILEGTYEAAVSAWLHANVERSTNVLLIGSTEGFHELTLADKLTSLKQMVIVHDVESRDHIELNLRTNGHDVGELFAVISVKAFLQSSLVDSFAPGIVVVRDGYLDLIPHVEQAFPKAIVATVADGTVAISTQDVSSLSAQSDRKVA